MNTRQSIQSGHGLDRSAFPEEWKGSEAKRLWEDSAFKYGMEYGYLLAIAERHLDESTSISLDSKDREVLQTWLDYWDASDCPLAGDISYEYLAELVKRLGLRVPRRLASVLSGEFERRMREKGTK